MKGKNTVKDTKKALPKIGKKDLAPSRSQAKKVRGGMISGDPDELLIP